MEPSLKAQRALAKALECLEDARWNLQSGRAAAAVNRAYYAVFHTAEAALLARHGLEFSKHGTLIGAFGQHFVKTGMVSKRLNQILRRAFDARQEADYDLVATVTLDQAGEIHAAAEEFVAGVRPLVEGNGSASSG